MPTSMTGPSFAVFTIDDFSLPGVSDVKSEHTYTYGAHVPLITRGSFKSLKGGSGAVWPRHLEAALMQALFDYALTVPARRVGQKKHVNRNRYISNFILKTTKQLRTPTQIASRLQQIQTSSTDNRVKNLIAHCDVPDSLALDLLDGSDGSVDFIHSPGTSASPSPISPHSPTDTNPVPFQDTSLSFPPPAPPPPMSTSTLITMSPISPCEQFDVTSNCEALPEPPKQRPRFYRPRFADPAHGPPRASHARYSPPPRYRSSSPPRSPYAFKPPILHSHSHPPPRSHHSSDALPAPSRAARVFLAPVLASDPPSEYPASSRQEYPTAIAGADTTETKYPANPIPNTKNTDSPSTFEESALRTTQSESVSPSESLPVRSTSNVNLTLDVPTPRLNIKRRTLAALLCDPDPC